MKSTRNSHSRSVPAAGIEHSQLGPALCRLCGSSCLYFLLLAFLLVLGVSSLQADTYVEDYALADSDFLLRISAQNHGSGTYKSAKDLASLFNWQQLSDEFAGGQQRAIPISTTNAEASLTDLLERRSELAIVRADLADKFFSQSGESGGPSAESLRLVSTHTPEFLHIVVRGDYDGATLKSLDRKRVNIGGDSDGARRDVAKILLDAGAYMEEIELIYAPIADGLSRLEAGTVDAVIFFDQAPSRLVADKIENLEFRLLPYHEIVDGGIDASTQTKNKYFSTASSAEFYASPQVVNSLSLATYLLTRIDVPQASIESIVQLLNVQPQLNISTARDPAETEKPSADKAGQQATSAHLRPYRISESLSPIPLHPSSQLLIDIFADPATVGLSRDNATSGLASNTMQRQKDQ